MVITIDGPAGSGKSTVAEEVARRLGLSFLNTGHMYRALGLAARRREADLTNPIELAYVARHAKIEFDWTKYPPPVILNGERVTHLLGGRDVSEAASYIAVVGAIREMMVRQQREIGEAIGDLVTEGRDQGTVVFPDAAFKFYIDASPEERARRRFVQLRRGEPVDYKDILDGIQARDKRDRERLVGPLEKPKDAIAIDSTHLSFDEVVRSIIGIVESGPHGRAAASGAADNEARVVSEPASDTGHPSPARGTRIYRFCQSLAALLVRVFFDLKSYGSGYVPRDGGVLVVSNHVSYLDPVIVAGLLPRPFAFLADSYLWGFKPFGWLITRLNAFPVRQGKGDVGAMKQTIALLNGGWALTVFPEGMRSPTGRLCEVQAGAALIVRRTDVPVVPAYIWGAFAAWPKHRLLPRRKPVRITYRPPMDMSRMSSKEITATLTRVFAEMEAEAIAHFGEPGRQD